jgi:acyl-CoA reductase-like NAD-dependent aldehyde dehydrogenase
VLLEVAELLDERRDRFAAEVAAVEGVRVEEAAASVGAAADRWLWYAGWADKITGLLGAVHPVAGPYVSWSAPRPIGVVGAAAEGTLLGLVDVLAPALAAGATAVVVTRHDGVVPVGLLAETLAVCPLPAGAVSLLTGDVGELAAALSSSVDGLDLAAAPPEVATAAHGIPMPPPGGADAGAARLRAWSPVTTVWHPIGR